MTRSNEPRKRTMRTRNKEGLPMRKRTVALLAGVLALSATAVLAEGPTLFDPERGEISPDSRIPTRAELLNAIRNSAPQDLMMLLEYGERLECAECMPLLEERMYTDEDPNVRRLAAWWLRRRMFGSLGVEERLFDALRNSSDPVRRARAAMGLGEFQSAGALPAFLRMAASDPDATVREAVVKAAVRLNHRRSWEVLVEAMDDADVSVRLSALRGVLKVNGFAGQQSVIDRLGDEDPRVRRLAAQIAGKLGITSAADTLQRLLLEDEASMVRQAAAWALGKLGVGRSALTEARSKETNPRVRDAIEIALVAR